MCENFENSRGEGGGVNLRGNFGKSRGEGGHTANPFRGGEGGYGYFLEPHNIRQDEMMTSNVKIGSILKKTWPSYAKYLFCKFRQGRYMYITPPPS